MNHKITAINLYIHTDGENEKNMRTLTVLEKDGKDNMERLEKLFAIVIDLINKEKTIMEIPQ